MSRLSAERMQQQHLRDNENNDRRTDRFLDLEMFTAAPMTASLSGLEAEYAVALIYSSESGRREATVTFDVGQERRISARARLRRASAPMRKTLTKKPGSCTGG